MTAQVLNCCVHHLLSYCANIKKKKGRLFFNSLYNRLSLDDVLFSKSVVMTYGEKKMNLFLKEEG